LRRKGLALGLESAQVGASVEKTVGDLMVEPVAPVDEDMLLRDIALRFRGLSNNRLPVEDADGRLKGVISIHELKGLLGGNLDSNPLRARDLMRPPAAIVTPDQRLVDILPVVLAGEHRNIPVVNSRLEMRLIGLLPKAEVLALFSDAISKSVVRG
jgi:CBS domain-containing protein